MVYMESQAGIYRMGELAELILIRQLRSAGDILFF